MRRAATAKRRRSANLRPTRTLDVDGRGILVFDDVLPETVTQALTYGIQALPYELGESFDHEFHCALEEDVLLGFAPMRQLFEVISSLAVEHAPALVQEPVEQHFAFAYCAAMRAGDHTRVHRDIDCADCISFLYYANARWDASWGGETVFFDEDYDAVAAVSPRPGRLVAFNASILHRAGVPTSGAPAMRYGMSVFWRCARQLGS